MPVHTCVHKSQITEGYPGKENLSHTLVFIWLVRSPQSQLLWRDLSQDPDSLYTVRRNVPINQKAMFCLLEIPGNFSDSSNPSSHMDSLLKHKNWNRGEKTKDFILKKNLKHAFCSTQPTCRMPTENPLPVKRKPSHNQCMHSEVCLSPGQVHYGVHSSLWS